MQMSMPFPGNACRWLWKTGDRHHFPVPHLRVQVNHFSENGCLSLVFAMDYNAAAVTDNHAEAVEPVRCGESVKFSGRALLPARDDYRDDYRKGVIASRCGSWAVFTRCIRR